MTFSEIRSDVYFLCNTTSATLVTASVLRGINIAYNKVTYMIWDSQDAWQFDDRTKTDLPYFRKDLVHAQQDYSIPATLQKIERIEVLDNAGNWARVRAMDDPDVEVALPEYLSVPNLPIKYSLKGNYISLYPSPASGSVTTTSGMAFYGSRDVTEFPSSAATASPGFAKQFHRLLAYSVAIDYVQDPAKLAKLNKANEELIKGMKKFYSKRMIERNNVIRPRKKKFWKQWQ